MSTALGRTLAVGFRHRAQCRAERPEQPRRGLGVGGGKLHHVARASVTRGTKVGQGDTWRARVARYASAKGPGASTTVSLLAPARSARASTPGGPIPYSQDPLNSGTRGNGATAHGVAREGGESKIHTATNILKQTREEVK